MPVSAAEGAVATDMVRNAASRERHVFYMRMIYALIAVLVLSVSGNVWLAQRGVVYRYFASDPSGRTRELQALDRPIQSSSRVLTWTASAVSQAFTFSFANLDYELNQSRPNFTGPGWNGFIAALKSKGAIDAVRQNMYVASAVPAKAPVIVDQGLVQGRYAWKIELPIIVTYQSATKEATQTNVVSLTVVQVPIEENPDGLGIEQVIVK